MSQPTPAQSPRYSPWLHRAALATLLATFPLIFLGGLVTTHGAGMSVPDWPNSYGYNMFLFPPSMWIGGIFYEHTHRLLGTLVGLLAIVFVVVAWAPSKNPAARRLFVPAATVFAVLAVAAWALSLKLVPQPTDAEHALSRSLPGIAILFLFLTSLSVIAFLCRAPEPRRWVRWLSFFVLLAVIAQGILGGLRVTEINIHLAVAHGIFAQLVLCLMAFAATVSSRWYVAPELPDRFLPGELVQGRKITAAAFSTFGMVLIQLIVGAMMRHYGAGLAIPDLPLAYGHLLPPTNETQVAAANAYRATLNSPVLLPVTFSQIWLHFAHRIGSVLVSAALLHLTFKILLRAAHQKSLRHPALALIALLLVQLSLGLATVYFRKPADVTTLHHTTGAIILMLTFITAIRARHLYASTSSQSVTPNPSLATA